MRTLSQAAARYGMCVILLNDTVSNTWDTKALSTRTPHQPTSGYTSNHPNLNPYRPPPGTNPRPHHPPQSNVKQGQKTGHGSLFPSTTEKPALGKTFAYCVDTHIFLSRVSRDMVEAAMTKCQGKSQNSMGGRGREQVCVCEVLRDRHSTRDGCWGWFNDASIRGWKEVLK